MKQEQTGQQPQNDVSPEVPCGESFADSCRKTDRNQDVDPWSSLTIDDGEGQLRGLRRRRRSVDASRSKSVALIRDRLLAVDLQALPAVPLR
ncbi:hypothetical protein ACFQE4_31130 [Streptomyces thermocoprophilus]|uniref:hypothetical protein n=1 Tax=Streptomyces thermocoprophilus TaxID=78356 RepID=UPI0036099E00